MLLKNTGEKIINVGRDILMPGEEKIYPNGRVDAGVIGALVSMGFLKVSKEAPRKADEPARIVNPVEAPELSVPFEAAAAEYADTEPKKPARNRGKKSE